MSTPQPTQCSKFLSYVLRHKPQAIGLTLDQHGWASIDELISKGRSQITDLSKELIEQVVFTNDKQRFALSEDGNKIRANQGHSVDIDIGLEPTEPPHVLFHGTATRFLPSIKEQGLKPGQRQHVHLSTNRDTAIFVGKRYGKPIVLEIDAKKMYEQGAEFMFSKNGVWLAKLVQTCYIINLAEID